jgi:hypothetical protein
MKGYYAIDNRESSKNGSVKVRILMMKRPSISGSQFYPKLTLDH